MASMAEILPSVGEPECNGFPGNVLSTDALMNARKSPLATARDGCGSVVGVEDVTMESEPVVASDSPCSYCGLCWPSTSLMQCVSTDKWFCNGRALGNISCIVHHALRSGHREFRVHNSVMLDSVADGGNLCCSATGNKDIISLGYVSVANKIVILSRDVFDCRDVKCPASLRHVEPDWVPLVQDKMVVDWVATRPSRAGMQNCRKVSVLKVNKLEDMWKRGRTHAVIGDVRLREAPQREEILPVALAYPDAPVYQAIFSNLISLEVRTSKYIKERQTQTGVDVYWSTQEGKQIAEFVPSRRLGSHAVRLGDRILIKHPSYTWEFECIIVKYDHGSQEIVAFVTKNRKQNSRERQPKSVRGGYRIEFLWSGAQYERMYDAFERIVNDKDCVSTYLRDLLLGQDNHDISSKFCMEFKVPDNVSVPGIENINPSQEQAIMNALKSPVSLIQGPPGTGKTTTAAAIVYHLSRIKSGTILVATPSNTAADNIAERVARTGVRVTRVLSKSQEAIGSIVNHLTLGAQMNNVPHPSVRRYQVWSAKIEAGLQLSKEDLRRYRNLQSKLEKHVLQTAEVICVTCVCSADPRLSHLDFKTVLIDECTQSTEAESLIPIAKGCEHLILIGDQCQLGPIIINPRAKEFGLGQSLFERIMKNSRDPVRLNVQYRMHPALASFPSKAFYEGTLTNGLRAEDRQNIINFPWPSQNAPMMFWAQRGIEEMSSSGVSYLNRAESMAISKVVSRLLELGTKPSSIGIITPYEGQREQIVTMLIRGGTVRNMPMSDVEVSSVDAFQGREKDFIIFSCVRSNEFQGIGFLSDPRRLNVSITRARYGLIMLGNPDTLVKHPLWESLLCHFSISGALVQGPTLDSLTPCPLHASTVASSAAVPPVVSMSDFHPVKTGGDRSLLVERPTASDRQSVLES